MVDQKYASEETISLSHPSKKAPGGWKSVKYILGNETFEKMASMSLMANLVLYLRTMYNLDNVTSVNIVIIWSGFSNILPLLGAFLADAYLGKYNTILYGTISSLLGMSVLALTAGLQTLRPAHCAAASESADCAHHHRTRPWHLAVLYAALGLVAVGAGGIRPCNISFGADQFDTGTEKGPHQLGSFCNWYFFLFTVAIVFVLTAVAYVQTNVSWIIGFLIPSLCFLLSIAVFLLGRRTYVLVEPRGSVFLDMPKVLVAAFRKRKAISSARTPFHNPAGKLAGTTTRLGFLDKAAMIVRPSELDEAGNPVNSWRLCSLQSVEHLKCVLTSLPILLVGVGCFVAMNQPGTFGILQAIQMNRDVGKSFKIPPAWVKLTIMVTLSIWVVFYEKVYVPVIAKKRLTVRQRFNVGILMSILCMVIAGIVEKFRRETALKQSSFESPMSVLYLMIPFALAGLVEAFAAITLMEHFTTEWPERMRTVAGAIFFLALSLSSYLNSVIVSVINRATAINGKKPWLSGSDFNENRLDYYYYTIGAIGVLNLVYFHAFAKHFLVDSRNSVQDSEDRSVSKDSERAESV